MLGSRGGKKNRRPRKRADWQKTGEEARNGGQRRLGVQDPDWVRQLHSMDQTRRFRKEAMMGLGAPRAECLEQTCWVNLSAEHKSIRVLGAEGRVSVNLISRGSHNRSLVELDGRNKARLHLDNRPHKYQRQLRLRRLNNHLGNQELQQQQQHLSLTLSKGGRRCQHIGKG